MSRSILIVDDSALIRHSLRACIERNPNWTVCGEAENGEVAVEKVEKLHPDVVILDLAMPVMNGLEAARQIRRLAPHTAMLMLTMHSCGQRASHRHPRRALKVGGGRRHLFASLRSIFDGATVN